MGENESCNKCWHEHYYHHNGGKCQVQYCKCKKFEDG